MSDETKREDHEKVAREMRALLRTPGWKRIVEIYNAQATILENQLLYTLPTDKPESMADVQWRRGMLQGIRGILKLPETLLEQATEISKAMGDDEDA